MCSWAAWWSPCPLSPAPSPAVGRGVTWLAVGAWERALCTNRLPLPWRERVGERGRKPKNHPPPQISPPTPLQIGRAQSELQSRPHLVCRLLLEKKKKNV